MQLPQEHPKHTHDVLRVLPPPGTITAVTSLIFALKKCQQPKLPICQSGSLRPVMPLRTLGWLYATPLPAQNQASLLSPLATTSHRPLAPLTPHLRLENTLFTAIYSQTSFLCPQFRELLESFLLHLTGVTTTKQPIKISMGYYIFDQH